MSAAAPLDAERRRELLDALLAALAHTVGRDEHLPLLQELVESRAGPVGFSQLAEAVASIDVTGRSPEWREEWAELVDALRRAAEREQRLSSTGPEPTQIEINSIDGKDVS